MKGLKDQVVTQFEVYKAEKRIFPMVPSTFMKKFLKVNVSFFRPKEGDRKVTLLFFKIGPGSLIFSGHGIKMVVL